MSTIVTRAGKGSALTHNEVDANFVNLNNDKIEAAQTVTLTNKTISGANNTLSNIGNSSLTNSSVTIGSTSVSLGSTATTVSGLTLTSPTVNTPTVSGGTINNAVIGGTTPAAGTFTSLTDSGNLTFTGTGNRITGDFTNVANGVYIQTSTANAGSAVATIPNGTGNVATFQAYGSSDPSNSSVMSIGIGTNGTEAVISSFTRGTGTALPMRFNTGGSERMRVDTSGNVGIGTSSPGQKLTVAGTTNQLSLTTGTNELIARASSTEAALYTFQAIPLNFYTNNAERMRIDSSGNVGIGGISSGERLVVITSGNTPQILASNGTVSQRVGYAAFGSAFSGTVSNHPYVLLTNDTERLRVDTSGNVGIGTSSPTARLQLGNNVGSAGAANQLRLYEQSGAIFGFGISAGALDYRADAHVFYTSAASPTERMRIDSSGNLLVGTTTDNVATAGFRVINAASDPYLDMSRTGSASARMIGFYRNSSGSLVGQITTTSTATTYTTSSDYRLKHDIQPMTGALAKVAALKPCTYKWKADGSDGEGFIAHELAEVIPEAVSGEKDAVNEDGSIKPQGIDTSFLVATLTAALQEQQQMIEELKAKVAALENA
jgi:hypothetical protein